MNLDKIVAVISIIGYAVLIIATRRKNNFENFAVAGRNVGFMLMFMSLSALFVGPGWTLGLTHQGFTTGYLALFVASFYGIGKLIEGLVIAPKLRAKFTHAYSIGEVIGGPQSHNNKIVRFIAGFISFGLLVGFSVIMTKASGDIMNSFLDIPKVQGMLLVTGVVTAYSIFGGLKSSLITDAVQFTLFIILLPLLAIFVLASKDFNTEVFIRQAQMLTSTGFEKETALSLFGLAVTWLLGEMMVPPTVSTILASENSKTAKNAMVFSGFLMILWLALMLTLGVMSRVVLSDISGNDQVLLLLGHRFYAPGLFGVFAVALVGVVMSTQDNLLNSSSVLFTKDIFGVFKEIDEKSTYVISRLMCIVVGILSFVFASFIPSIIDALLFFYSIWVPSILVVVLFSIFINEHHWLSAIFSMMTGVVSSVTWNLFGYKEILPPILFGLVLSLMAYLVSHYFLIIKNHESNNSKS